MNTFDLNDLNKSFDSPLFSEEAVDGGIFDAIDVVNIPIEEIGAEAEGKAKTLIEDLTKFYYDEEFLKANPNFRKRVDNDMESLRMLLKMRAADEVTHDVLIKAIAANSGNASLYSSLTKIQDSMLKITTKIENIVTNLTNMIKGYQLEINWRMEQETVQTGEETDDIQEDVASTHRGSKSFIEHMQKIEQKMFDENSDDSEDLDDSDDSED